MSIILYNLFLWLYQISVRLISPWNKKAAAWVQGRRGILEKIRSSGISGRENLVWMHCASLGEFEQGRPVIESLRQTNPEITVLITFFSPSGYKIRRNYPGADYVFYLPADSAGHARRFLDLVKPVLVLWIKYDYWFYYLRELHKRKIPALLISPLFRTDQPFFKWYGNLHRLMLDSFRAFFVQNESSKELLSGLGISHSAIVSGDTRFDRVIDIAAGFQPFREIAAFCGSAQVIVAGSTWEEDEEELDHYANTHPEVKFIIVPHEIEEDDLKDTEALFHHSIRYSALRKDFDANLLSPQASGKSGEAPHVLIIDNIGMLSSLYHYATICYVGGGFGDDGVHNVLEAAVYGKPVVTGPVIEKYLEVVELAE
ncbi:MAG: glycosyltransferase N-terminal domain-containing protein, partial [Bacteroidota bacterium]|nr:glycosyltransferase N-terminal domain-containing protein [Bacteroidota bacterium]